MNDKEYYSEAKKIRRHYQVLELKDLLVLNCKYYSFSEKKTSILKVYNEMQNTIDYSESEKEEIITECISEIKKEGNIIIDKDGNVRFKK